MLVRFRIERSRILGIEVVVAALAFPLLALRVRLPEARSVAVNIYDTNRIAHIIVAATITLPFMFPSWIPVAHAHPAPRPVTTVIGP